MKKRLCKILAPVLVLAVLLSGCRLFGGLYGFPTHFSNMEYTRPDMAEMESLLANVREVIPQAESAKQIMDAFWPYYMSYTSFATNYQLSFIQYCIDMTDIYWEQEYNYCLDQTAGITADYDQLLHALAASPLRQELEGEAYFGADFFADFQGESLWDETLTEMVGRENELLSQYYTLSAEPVDYTNAYFDSTGAKMEGLFLELIALRQDIAAYAQYPDYPSFAYDFYHYRDYTPEQALAYTAAVQEELVPLAFQVDWTALADAAAAACTQEQALAYVRAAAKAMGGTVWESYQTMEKYGMYHISPGENKYPGSFEVFLYGYGLPFILVNPAQQARDKLTLTHEFGHFCNDFVSQGTVAGVDVTEVFSQGLEYLSLFYGEADPALAQAKLAEGLEVFLTQSAYASFEQRVYALTGEDLTTENVRALFRQAGEDFGFDTAVWDSRSYVLLPHLFSSPMYLISYIVSNDAALQLYLLEKQTSGAGLKVYEENLATQQQSLLAFLEEAGLESPFAQDHLTQIAAVLAEALVPKT